MRPLKQQGSEKWIFIRNSYAILHGKIVWRGKAHSTVDNIQAVSHLKRGVNWKITFQNVANAVKSDVFYIGVCGCAL